MKKKTPVISYRTILDSLLVVKKENKDELNERVVAIGVLLHRIQYDIYAHVRSKNVKHPKNHPYKKLVPLRDLQLLKIDIEWALQTAISSMDILALFDENKYLKEYSSMLKVPKLIDWKMARKGW
jgi:hypothetical protein